MSSKARTPMAWGWILLCTVLAVTGTGQMPIFKRYYVADIPGFGWTADFYLTHTLHYAAGAVFLFAVCYLLGKHLFSRGWRFTRSGALRGGMIAVIVVTGVFRVAKNLQDVWFAPEFVMLIDWTHLAAAILLGVFALQARRKREPYIEKNR